MNYSIRIYIGEDIYSHDEREDFIVDVIKPLMCSLNINEYHVLYETMAYHYPNGAVTYGDAYIALRVQATKEQIHSIISSLEKLDTKYDALPYFLLEDAYNRITRKYGIQDYFKNYHEGWHYSFISQDQKVEEFVKLLKVFGKCANIIQDEFGRVPKDSWLMSVLIHLILNSLGFTHKQEEKVREFRYI